MLRRGIRVAHWQGNDGGYLCGALASEPVPATPGEPICGKCFDLSFAPEALPPNTSLLLMLDLSEPEHG